jgi:fatty acid desaturase
MSHHATTNRPPATTRADVAQLHEFEHWPARWVWPLFAGMLALQLAAVTLPHAYWPLLLVIWPAIGAIMFVFVLAFHDASHGRFHPVVLLNEGFGHVVGTFGFTPLNVYRFAHARHHASLARPGDPELWPFTLPNVPRTLRIAAAFCEIVFGFVYTPVLFLRSVLVGKPTPRERTLIIRGYVGCALFWAALFAASEYFNLWRPLLVGTIVPALLSGMMQSLNKYEQHMGLHGHSVLGLTRTVVDRTRSSEIISAAMLYNDYHGTHHRYAKIPYYHLPKATAYTLASASEPCPVYPSIVSAALDMLKCLRDPKIGPQWVKHRDASDAGVSQPVAIAQTAQPQFTGDYAA